ncbi:transaldolase [Vagococcus coleopterorum]|uniref:Transaldolase n=1 Tax=Vagococcus coleopterorum TaxID=2714946 RepID=A0A6G8AP91_9ENTE|nr:transaldolase [Vagococcus coleopterorum]QIL46807.1 transaldolase [Vagococcus coleopterorum]
MLENLNVKIYSDGAEIDKMKEAYKEGMVSGFTTNPSLMKKAGITDYVAFAEEAVKEIPDKSISFEVFADDFETMEKEAEKIASFGENVFIKIPIMNTKGESSIPLIERLSAKGFSLNITAILTIEQVKETVDALAPGTKNIVSVFAGRVADTGIDPTELMKQSVAECAKKDGTELLWASTRELINIFQADEIGADIITVPPAILSKLSMVGMDLEQLSKETVIMFNNDIKDLGFTIL